jgi:ankyrin repeat protein
MDDFTLQRSVFRHIAKTRPSFDQGIKYVLGRISEAPHGSLWTPCVAKAPKLLAGMLDSWVAWMDRLDKTMPLPENTEVLWFEVPSELNPALTSVSAYDTLGPASEAYGMDEPRTWPENEDGTTHESGLWSMPQLDQLLALAGWETADDELMGRLRPGVYALHYAATALQVLNGLPRTSMAARWMKRPKGLSVAIGWASGDCDPLGTVVDRAWQKMRRAKAILTASSPREIDIETFGFNLRKYLAAGGDPNARNSKGQPAMIAALPLSLQDVRALKGAGADFTAVDAEGGSVLTQNWMEPFPVIRELIRCGANPDTVDNKGKPALFAFRSQPWKEIKELIDLGANPNRSQGDTTFFDVVICYGNIPRSGLEWLWKRGVRFGPVSPFQRIAEWGFLGSWPRKSVSERLDFCLSKKIPIDAPQDCTPLWTALLSHAKEVLNQEHEMEKQAKRGDTPRRPAGYQHDWIATLLLKRGANPNARYAPGHSSLVPANATPLMVQRYDDDKLVKALLKHGADPTLKSAEGKTALDYARRAQKRKDRLANVGVDAVVKQLERAEAKWTGKPPKPGK